MPDGKWLSNSNHSRDGAQESSACYGAGDEVARTVLEVPRRSTVTVSDLVFVRGGYLGQDRMRISKPKSVDVLARDGNDLIRQCCQVVVFILSNIIGQPRYRFLYAGSSRD